MNRLNFNGIVAAQIGEGFRDVMKNALIESAERVPELKRDLALTVKGRSQQTDHERIALESYMDGMLNMACYIMQGKLNFKVLGKDE